MEWHQVVTLCIAVLGAGLGVTNLWLTFNKERVRLRVRPMHVHLRGQSGFGIEVVNLSSFALVIEEAGFVLGAGKPVGSPKLTVTSPFLYDGGPWPRRLEPRQSVTVCFDHAFLMRGVDLGVAYVRTACNEYASGSSPALENLRAIAAQRL